MASSFLGKRVESMSFSGCVVIKVFHEASLKKVSVSTNPTNRIMNGRRQTFFTPPQKTFCIHTCVRVTRIARNITRECQTRCVSERTRAMHCPHASQNLRALNSRTLASTRKWNEHSIKVSQNRFSPQNRFRPRKLTLEYSQSNSRALAIELASTRKYTRNFCGCVTQSY